MRWLKKQREELAAARAAVEAREEQVAAREQSANAHDTELDMRERNIEDRVTANNQWSRELDAQRTDIFNRERAVKRAEADLDRRKGFLDAAQIIIRESADKLEGMVSEFEARLLDHGVKLDPSPTIATREALEQLDAEQGDNYLTEPGFVMGTPVHHHVFTEGARRAPITDGTVEAPGHKREPSLAWKLENGQAVIMGMGETDDDGNVNLVIVEKVDSDPVAEAESITVQSAMSGDTREVPVKRDVTTRCQSRHPLLTDLQCDQDLGHDGEVHSCDAKPTAESPSRRHEWLDEMTVNGVLDAALSPDERAKFLPGSIVKDDPYPRVPEDCFHAPEGGEQCECGATEHLWCYSPSLGRSLVHGESASDEVWYCPLHGPNTPARNLEPLKRALEDAHEGGPEDDGAEPEPSEIDAVMNAAISDSTALLGYPVLYETDGRGGKRYTLPATITVLQKTHPDLPFFRAAQEAGRIIHPKYDTGEPGTVVESEVGHGYYVPDNPVPIPLDGTAHLKVLTPGPKGVYDEFSVPYDPTGATQRSWRFLENQQLPF